MSYPVLNSCPICDHTLSITKLECTHCHTTIENSFSLSKFASLSARQMNFVEVFLVSRGNIKEVEKELGISYPTVRSRLNEVIQLLGHEKKEEEELKHTKSEIISMLERDEITAQEAVKLLKGGGK